MPNMSYCRFTNTRSDLADCLEAIRDETRLSGFEAVAGEEMFQEFLAFCQERDIIDGYDDERIGELFAELKED